MWYSLSFKYTDFIITPLAVYGNGTHRSLNSKTRMVKREPISTYICSMYIYIHISVVKKTKSKNQYCREIKRWQSDNMQIWVSSAIKSVRKIHRNVRGTDTFCIIHLFIYKKRTYVMFIWHWNKSPKIYET